MRDVVVVKLGGSLITDKASAGSISGDNIDRVCAILAQYAKNEAGGLVVVSGGGSVGHHAAVKYRVREGLAACDRAHMFRMSQAMLDLKFRIAAVFESNSVPSFVFHEASLFFCERDGLQIHREPLKMAVDNGFVAVMSGGLTFDQVVGVRPLNGDLVAEAIHRCGIGNVRRSIMLSDVDGVLDGRGVAIDVITPARRREIDQYIWRPSGIDVTGGILAKVDAGLMLAACGIETVICSGLSLTLEEFVRCAAGCPGRGTVIRSGG